MSFGKAEATPPSGITSGDGQFVFRSFHLGTVMNETDTPFQVLMTATLTDSLGNAATPTVISNTAQPLVALVLSAHCELPVSNYIPNTQVMFTADTTVEGGGVLESDSQSNIVTVPVTT